MPAVKPSSAPAFLNAYASGQIALLSIFPKGRSRVRYVFKEHRS